MLRSDGVEGRVGLHSRFDEEEGVPQDGCDGGDFVNWSSEKGAG